MSPRTQQLKTPGTYVSGHHHTGRHSACKEFFVMPNQTVVQCVHESHRTADVPSDEPEEPRPVPVPQAGVVDDLDELAYHAHPALSSTGAKQLLANPARFRWIREHGQAPKRAFDFGSLAHLEVLGKGAQIDVVEAEDWRTKAAREQRDKAREAGLIPALVRDVEQARAMAAAVRAHPAAADLFSRGDAERSMFWTDPATGVPMRARTDWFRPGLDGGRALVVDYKTAAQSVAPKNVPRIIHSWGYHQQADWYLRGVRELGLHPEPVFLFVLQEKTEPYPVTVVELDEEALRVGRGRNDAALQLWLRCNETGVWPAYGEGVELVSLPGWAIAEHDNSTRVEQEQHHDADSYAYDPDEENS